MNDKIQQYGIPNHLIINYDETGQDIVPQSDYTWEVEGAKEVKIAHGDDKRQITAVILAANAAGELLPPQVIYAGKTKRSHCTNIPSTWDNSYY